MFGLNPEVAQFVINEYNTRLRAGEVFTTQLPYYGFLDGFPVYFAEVPKQHFSQYCGFGLWFYGSDNFRVLQVIYPDKTTGVWPWDSEPNAHYLWHQPVLGDRPKVNK